MSYKTYKVRVYDDGDKYWFLNGRVHREDGPAVERANGTKEWYLNGKRHREDGPAVELANDDKYWFWYLNGKCHLEDGPAVELANDDKYWFWYLHGKQFTEAEFKQQTNTCAGKVIEIDGKKYRLQAI